jgi:hypothetical protein
VSKRCPVKARWGCAITVAVRGHCALGHGAISGLLRGRSSLRANGKLPDEAIQYRDRTWSLSPAVAETVVIASKAKQSSAETAPAGLFRRFAPRNDEYLAVSGGACPCTVKRNVPLQGVGVYSFFGFHTFFAFCHFFPVRLKQTGGEPPISIVYAITKKFSEGCVVRGTDGGQ